MAEFPALNLWTDAYLSDTRHLSTLEHGAYLLLLMEAWRRPKCDLPDDDMILARLAGLTIDEWTAIKDVVLDFWKFDGRSKTWSQKRLMIERDKARKRSRVQSEKAAKRWDKKKNNDATAIPEECPGDASTTTTTTTTTTINDEDTSSSEGSEVRSRENSKSYAFSGATVKLNQADYDRWRKIYHAIPDFDGELQALDDWLREKGSEVRQNWFQRVSGALNKKHQAALKAKALADSGEDLPVC